MIFLFIIYLLVVLSLPECPRLFMCLFISCPWFAACLIIITTFCISSMFPDACSDNWSSLFAPPAFSKHCLHSCCSSCCWMDRCVWRFLFLFLWCCWSLHFFKYLTCFILFLAEVSCWILTGERQTAVIRSKYVQVLLNQDMSFFDTYGNNGDIVSQVLSDVLLIQSAISEKVCSMSSIFVLQRMDFVEISRFFICAYFVCHYFFLIMIFFCRLETIFTTWQHLLEVLWLA